MRMVFASLLLLAACQTAGDQARGPETVTVRMGAGSQTLAERACGSPVRPESTHQGTSTIIYRCVRDAPTAPQSAASEQPLPATVSVAVGPNSEEIAARECGSAVRPETVHHESNVITFRCVREVR